MITVLFSCKKCGLVKQPVQVPAREHAGVDVIHYVRQVIGACVSAEHERLSPHCKTATIDEVYIPTPDGAEFLGQQIE